MPTIVTFISKNRDLLASQIDNLSNYFVKFLAQSDAVCAQIVLGYTRLAIDNIFKVEFQNLGIIQKEASDYLMNELSMCLHKCGIGNLFVISSIEFVFNPNDKLYDQVIKKAQTLNSELLDKLGFDIEIPEKYLCNLTGQIMDKPVYIKESPYAICDQAQLFNWIFKNENISPYTRNKIHYEDIIYDHVLQEEIRVFIETTFTNQLELQRKQLKIKEEKLQAILTQYKQSDAKIACLSVCLRRAAALNHIENLKFLLSLKFDVNIQDTNPQNMKTALHWAAKNGHQEAACLLLNAGAKFDILDAFQKTALDYAKIETHTEILKLFGQEVVEDAVLKFG